MAEICVTRETAERVKRAGWPEHRSGDLGLRMADTIIAFYDQREANPSWMHLATGTVDDTVCSTCGAAATIAPVGPTRLVHRWEFDPEFEATL